MQKILKDKHNELINLCKILKIKKMYAFGSVVSGEFRKDSDIDFLISFLDSLSIEEYTDNYFALYYKLIEIFDRKIDIVSEKSLSNPYFIESVNKTKELLYEE